MEKTLPKELAATLRAALFAKFRRECTNLNVFKFRLGCNHLFIRTESGKTVLFVRIGVKTDLPECCYAYRVSADRSSGLDYHVGH